MSYRLSLEQPLPDAVRAVAVERLERAARRLRDEHGDDPVDAVHGARKDLKKTRAVLRLARPCLKKKIYRAENAELRGIGRTMSGGRDADVMVETVDKLAERYAGRLPKRQFTALSRRLADRARSNRTESGIDDLAAALDAARMRAERWPLDGCDDDAVVAGATRAYGRGRKAFAAAERDPTPELLHEWRKRVKDLWYHHRLLAGAWPGPVKAFADEADTLGELLGDDHDLATLDELLEADPDVAPPSVELDRVRELIAARRAELAERAFRLGRRLYAEKPKAFARRLAGYLAAERELQTA